MRSLKLIGARTFGSPAAGLTSPMNKGEIQNFDDGIAGKLMALTYTDTLGNIHPMFSEDVSATMVHPDVQSKPLDQAVKDGDFAPAAKKAPARKRGGQ
jgi:hypothetical protein